MREISDYRVRRVLANGVEEFELITKDEDEAYDCFYDDINKIQGDIDSGYAKKKPYAVVRLELLVVFESGHRDIIANRSFVYK